jgi:hypothetical protein
VEALPQPSTPAIIKFHTNTTLLTNTIVQMWALDMVSVSYSSWVLVVDWVLSLFLATAAAN